MLNRNTIFSKPNLTSSIHDLRKETTIPKSPLHQELQKDLPSFSKERLSKANRSSMIENSTMWLIEFEQFAKSFNSPKKKPIDPYMSSIMGTIFPGEFPVDDLHRQKVQRDLPLFLGVLLNTLTNVNRIMFLVHECQWMDPSAWNVVLHLMKTCPRLIIVLLSRPEKMYMQERVRFWALAKQQGFQINLKGFDREDMKDFIMHAWSSMTNDVIKEVDNELLDRVRETSGGNPLFAKSILITIKSKNAYFVEKQRLNLTGSLDIKGIMPGSDMHSLIVSQFDRLEPVFQVFLKIASLLGQQFFLIDVLLFITDGKIIGQQDDTSPFKKPQKEIVQMIAQWDKYNFIMLHSNPQDVTEDSNYLFAFKNSVIKESIYSTMLVSHRQQMHLSIAKYLEEKMDDKNLDRLLLMIYEHYAVTDDSHIEKKKLYLEKVSDYFFQHKLMNEAVKYYQLLLDMVVLVEQKTGVQAPNEKKCKWLANTSEAYLGQDKVLLAEPLIKRALGALEVEIPIGSAVMNLKMKFLRQKCLKFVTKEEKETHSDKSKYSYEKQALIRRSLHLYALISEELRNFEISEFCHLKAYVISSEYCSDDEDHSLYLSNMAFNVFVNTGSIKAIDGSRVAVESITNNRDATRTTASMSIWKNHCHLCAYAGEIDNADLYATRYIKACTSAGTLKWICDAYMFSMLMKYLKDEKEKFLLLANSLQNFIRPDSDPETVFWAQFSCLYLSSVGRTTAKEAATIIAENLARKSLDEAYQRIDQKFAEVAVPFHTIMANPEDPKTVKKRMEHCCSYIEELPMIKWGYWLGILYMLEYINENPESDRVYEIFLRHVMNLCTKQGENTLAKLIHIFCKGLIHIVQGSWKSGANEWVKAFVNNKNFDQYTHLLEIMKAGITKYGQANLINAIVKTYKNEKQQVTGQRKASIVHIS
eukprot:NODE_53_length_30760_cov_1.203712.p2 type:complete len:925 gc:universal NODE_53_length_30760_cov_1.203712:21408-18634(-)